MTLISNSKQYIFVHLYKCAGTSIEKALENSLEWNDILLGSTSYGEEIQVIYRKKFSLTKHSNAQTIRNVVGNEVWNKYYKFSFVRHPLDRMISLYEYFKTYYFRGYRGLATRSAFFLMRLNLLPPQISKIATVKLPFKWPGVQAAMTSANFSEFIRSEHLESAPAAFPQFNQLSAEGSGELIVDYVGKVETIDEDWQHISESLNINSSLPSSNRSLRKYKDWRSYYTLEDINFMVEKYKIDLEAFGYTV